MSQRTIFGSVIALILLGLYVFLIWSAWSLVGCTPSPACKAAFTNDMASALSLISGLVSALVIAELAITEPGEPLAGRALAANPGPRAKNFLQVIAWTYVGVWMLCGLVALVTGWKHPDAVESLTTLGKAWLGLAIAAGYAYFGIGRPQSPR